MRKLISTLAVLAVAGVGAFWWLTQPKLAVGAEVNSLVGDAARGKIVFDAGGCSSCHATPGQEDRLVLGGGFELKTPFGSFFPPNISPNPRDGIGRWTTADLANAMLAGVSPDGSHYYPAFPYATYAHMKVQDVADLMAYLKTLPPTEGVPRPHNLPFPMTFRRGVGLWKLLYLDRTPITDQAGQTAEWNRGHYLVDALGHCAECHSGRTLPGGIDEAYRYAGGPDPEGKGMIPNITQAKDGIGDWSKADIVEVLTSGLTPEPDEVSGSMAEVVKNTSLLPKADREAMAEYIKSLPPRASPPKPAPKQ